MQRHRHTDHSHTDSQAHRFTSSQTYISFDISPGSKYVLIKKRGAIFSITWGTGWIAAVRLRETELCFFEL